MCVCVHAYVLLTLARLNMWPHYTWLLRSRAPQFFPALDKHYIILAHKYIYVYTYIHMYTQIYTRIYKWIPTKAGISLQVALAFVIRWMPATVAFITAASRFGQWHFQLPSFVLNNFSKRRTPKTSSTLLSLLCSCCSPFFLLGFGFGWHVFCFSYYFLGCHSGFVCLAVSLSPLERTMLYIYIHTFIRSI